MKLAEIGVTSTKEKQFIKKGIRSVEDLVQFLPKKYNDFRKETGILPEPAESCVKLIVNDVKAHHSTKVPMLVARCSIASTGEALSVIWFRQNYLYQKVSGCIGNIVYAAGRVTYDPRYDTYNMTMPTIFEPHVDEAQRIYPVYSKIDGMSSEYLRDKISAACRIPGVTEEILPPELLGEKKLLPMRDAVQELHFPTDMKRVERAKERILYNDMLYFAVCNELSTRMSAAGSAFGLRTLRAFKRIKDDLPFDLTADQNAAVESMISYIREGKRINALIQGDVGCGKTVVAAIMLALFADNGYQTALMAPTEVLAEQHYEKISNIVEPLGLRVVFLGGTEMKKKERTAIINEIADGTAQIIIGTQAIIADSVQYHNLALVVTDEEHKFGVAQRSTLVEKAAVGVHVITMSATPIPRSLAQVMYGNTVQLHTINTMPKNRKPVITGIGTTKEKLYKSILKQINLGHQIYVVCPMIEASEKVENVRSVAEVKREYEKAFDGKNVRIASLTGRDSKAVTQETISKFKNGEIDILIGTTVIEVGVDIPNATIMVISNAERFGLASLHQLRGRVGRGEYQSYCVLQSENPTPEAQQRLEAMCRTTNGFEIAEADLEIRGAGDFLGVQQSGTNKYLTLMLAYPDVYKNAQKIAIEMIDNDVDCPMMQRVRETIGEDNNRVEV